MTNNSSMALDWVERAHNHFPAGSNGEYDLPADLVRVFKRGNGAEIWDSEDRRYYDYTMAWGSALVGHAHPQVVEANSRQVQNGINFSAMSTNLVELAERLAEITPCLEKMRFVSTGTKATMTCIRIARGVTGKSKVLKFEGAFHGSHIEGVANFFWNNANTLPAAQMTGTGGASVVGDLLISPYNNLEAAEQLIAEYASDLAAVIIDPVQRSILANHEFMQGLRDASAKHGVLLIFDEVVSGFRLGLGGAVEYYGVSPDLLAYGKALGGGMPIAALGRRTDLMDEVREDRHHTNKYVWAASTTGGRTVTTAAAHAVIDILSLPDSYDHLYKMGKLLRNGIAQTFSKQGITAQVYDEGPLAQFKLTDTSVVNMETEATGNNQLRRKIDLELVRQGIFINPMLTKIYVSLAHDEAAVQAYVDALETAVRICCT